MKSILITILAALLLQDAPAPRIPEPDADAQKQALKAIKDLFKDEYAKKSPADQAALARKLIKTSADAGLDSASRHACLSEARDISVTAAETDLALEAITLLGKSFTIAVPAAKLTALGKLATGIREPEKLRTLAKGYFDVAKEAVVSEDYETAGAAATKAETLARAVKETALSDRVAELKKDLVTLKSELQKVKAALDNPATGDADAVGRYLCFVRNDWTNGLKLLAESGKSPLKELAAKDLAAPVAAEAQVELGDAWWQLAQAERISWKKLNLQARARTWYDQAQPSVTGLVKIRLDKRLAEMESSSPGGGLNLLALIDPKSDAVHGDWTMEDGVLVVKQAPNTLSLQIPYQPPEEYDLHVRVKRVGSTDSAMIGFVVAGTQAVVMVDGYQTNNVWLSGFEMLDGKLLRDQSGCYKGKQLIPPDKPVTIDIQVRKTMVSFGIDGKKLLSLEGAQIKLANRADSGTPDPKALFIGGWNGRMGFADIRITPISGPGKKTR